MIFVYKRRSFPRTIGVFVSKLRRERKESCEVFEGVKMVGIFSLMTGTPGPSGFGSASTAEQVTEGIDASNLTAIVTGNNTRVFDLFVFFLVPSLMTSDSYMNPPPPHQFTSFISPPSSFYFSFVSLCFVVKEFTVVKSPVLIC